MSLIAENPIFQREARWGRRLQRARRDPRIGIPALLTGVWIGWLYWRGLSYYVDPMTAWDQGGLWRTSVYGLLGVLMLLAATLTASSIAREKEQQTWELLALTKITPAQVLTGKWLGRLVPLLWPVALLAPLLVISAASADLDLPHGLLTVLILALTALAYGMLGLLCSFLAKTTMAAVTSSLTLTLLTTVGTWVIASLTQSVLYSGGYSDYRGLMQTMPLLSPLWLNPFFTLSLVAAPADSSRISSASMPPDTALAAHPVAALTAYAMSCLAFLALAYYYLLTRYRRAQRGGRPLGDPLK